MNVRDREFRWAFIGLWSILLASPLVCASSLKAQATPSLRLISPADGATVDGPVTVRVEHSGIIFDGTKIGMAPEPGVGHWHINIDGTYAGLAVSNVIEIPNDAFPTIPAGQHTIMVNLHENNHAATTPPVEQSITLNFARDVTLAATKGGAPSLRIVDQGQGGNNGAPIVVRVEHSEIIFDGTKIGKEPEPGVGHWHINIDGTYAGLAVSNVIEIPNDAFPTIPAGQHTIMVNLHENNHAVTTPPVEQSFQISLSNDLSLGMAAPGAPATTATMGAANEHDAVTVPASGIGQLPNTGQSSANWTMIVVVVVACVGLGSLIMAWNRTRRHQAWRDQEIS